MKVQTNYSGANSAYVIDDKGTHYLISYSTVIAKRTRSGKVTLDRKYWDFSSTTGKHRNDFLGETKLDTSAKLDIGTYKLADLNK